MTREDPSPAIIRRFSRLCTDSQNRIGKLTERLRTGERETAVSGLPGGSAFFLASLVRESLGERLIYITSSEQRAGQAKRAFQFFAGLKQPPPGAKDSSELARAQSGTVICADITEALGETVAPERLSEASVVLRISTSTSRTF